MRRKSNISSTQAAWNAPPPSLGLASEDDITKRWRLRAQSEGNTMERPLIYELINAAKEALKPQHPDAVTKDTVVTQKTQLQYWTNAKRIFGVDTEAGKIIPPTNPEVVIAAVRSANTLSTLRMHARSVRHASLLALSALLKRADIAQRNGNWNEVERIVTDLQFNTYTVLAQMMPADYKDGWGAAKPRHGKKSSLKGLPTNWRELVTVEAHGQFRISVMVALLTGCRPAELEKGVMLEFDGDGLYATIQGAKVKDTAGQKQRRFRIADHPITKLLIDHMDQSDEKRNAMMVKVEHGNSVTTHMREIGKKLWPKKKEAITVYTARHAMAADCKAAITCGANPDLVSQVLGHIVDKTASYYGSIFQSGGISVAPSDVDVPKAIRQKVRARNIQRAINLGLLKIKANLSNH